MVVSSHRRLPFKGTVLPLLKLNKRLLDLHLGLAEGQGSVFPRAYLPFNKEV